MRTELLEKDKEFVEISKYFDDSSEKGMSVRKEFERAFLRWYQKKEKLEEQIKKIKNFQKTHYSTDYYHVLNDLIDSKKEISSHTGKICTIINYINPGVHEIDEVVANIMKEVANKRSKTAENILSKKAWIDNKIVMRALIEIKPSAVDCLGVSLSENYDFMTMLITSYVGTSNQWRVFRKVGNSLKYNVKFVINLLRIIVEKYNEKDIIANLKDDFYKCLKYIYDVPFNENIFIINNEQILREIKLLEINKYVESRFLDSLFNKIFFEEDLEWIRKHGTAEERATKISQDIDSLTEHQSEDYVLMINLLGIDANFYPYASNRLKLKESFQNDAIKLGVPVEVVNSEEEKILEKRRERRAQIAEETKLRKEEKKERSKNIYSMDSYEYMLVEEFLDTDDDIYSFCKNNSLAESSFGDVFKIIVSLYPNMKRKSEEKILRDRAHKKEYVAQTVSAFMANEESFFNFAQKPNIDFKISDFMEYVEDKKEFTIFIINMINTKRLKMNDYVRLFSYENDWQKTIRSIQKFMKKAQILCPELEGLGKPIYLARFEVGQFSKYEAKFVRSDFVGSKIGVMNKDNSTKIVKITEERMDFILNYLNEKDEFICFYTVNETIKLFLNEWSE